MYYLKLDKVEYLPISNYHQHMELSSTFFNNVYCCLNDRPKRCWSFQMEKKQGQQNGSLITTFMVLKEFDSHNGQKRKKNSSLVLRTTSARCKRFLLHVQMLADQQLFTFGILGISNPTITIMEK